MRPAGPGDRLRALRRLAAAVARLRDEVDRVRAETDRLAALEVWRSLSPAESAEMRRLRWASERLTLELAALRAEFARMQAEQD